jgi:hypothetical protein
LWAVGDNDFSVIPVTSLLHGLAYSEGFPLAISVINDPHPCTSDIVEFTHLWNPDNGTFMDGSPFHDYNRDLLCRWSWEIKENKVKKIKLIVVEFDLEISPDCHYDGVRVRLGSSRNSKVGGVFCGYYPPGHVLIDVEVQGLFVEFYTDGNYEFKGFELQWIVHDEDCTFCEIGPRPPDKIR